MAAKHQLGDRITKLEATWTCKRCNTRAKEEILVCVDLECWQDMHSFETRCECGQRARFGIKGHLSIREALRVGKSITLIELAGVGPELH